MIGALDIGGTKIAAGMVDEHGQVLVSMSSPTDPASGVDEATRRMVNMLRITADQAGGVPYGIGIGCTGPVNPELGTIGKVEFMPNWEGVNLMRLISDFMGIGVAMENDADAAALGEWTWGVGRGTRNFLLVTVGTGIGVGIVLDGHLYRGVDAAHPEIGHHVIDPAGPLCSCGAHGCWESLSCGPALERLMQEHQPRSQILSAREICELAKQGNSIAMAAVQRTAHYFAIGLANLVTLFIPECIALSGGLMEAYSLFEEEIRSTIQASCGYVPHERVRILPAALGVQSGLIGAACVWLNHSATQK